MSEAHRHDTGLCCGLGAGVARAFASGAAVSNSREALRVFSGHRGPLDCDVGRSCRDAPLPVRGAGADAMQRITIARQWIERNPA